MTKSVDQDLQDPENWNWEGVERHTGNKNRRNVVSVAFSHADFQRVAVHAERIGSSISAFIREATLEKVRRQSDDPRFNFNGASSEPATFVNQHLSLNVRWVNLPPNVQVPNAAISEGSTVQVPTLT